MSESSHSDTRGANPYQSPIGSGEDSGPVSLAQQKPLTSIECRRLHRGVRQVAIAALVISLAMAGMPIGWMAFRLSGHTSESFAVWLRGLAPLLGCLVGLAVILFPYGLYLIHRVPGPHCRATVVAGILLAFAGLGLAATTGALLSGRAIIGLFALFAASSLAMFLMACAVTVVSFRLIAARLSALSATTWLDTSVILLASCGACVSLTALRALPQSWDASAVITIAFAAATTASVAILIGLHRTAQRLRMLASLTS
ncbi:MAG: hypothetical protein AAGA03_09850 [Planctomycetota bacterium]